MKRTWLLFSQVVTVLVAIYFVVATLQPTWLQRGNIRSSAGVSLLQAPSTPAGEVAPGSFAPAARKASPAVVSINTSKAVRHPRANDPWFQFFFGDQGPQEQSGLGSGVIISQDGYILTNNHVVEGADDIEVTLTDSRQAKAKVIGTDPETDLAILKIELDKLPVIVLGNSDQVAVGDRVLAIGNPFGVGQTVTSGIISALGRSQLGINTFENFIQTDAAINPGNSGGALVDANGNLLGINTAIYSRSGGSMGIGFAIPVSTAKMVLDGIVKDGKVTRGWIGVEPNELARAGRDLWRQGRCRRHHHRRAAGRPRRPGRHAPRRRDRQGGRDRDPQCLRAADGRGLAQARRSRQVRCAPRRQRSGAGHHPGARPAASTCSSRAAPALTAAPPSPPASASRWLFHAAARCRPQPATRSSGNTAQRLQVKR
jgi:S1-C subfamily serine protease